MGRMLLGGFAAKRRSALEKVTKPGPSRTRDRP
jgi:hypothetical protein